MREHTRLCFLLKPDLSPAHAGERRIRAIRLEPDGWSVGIIDQARLPHHSSPPASTTLEDVVAAIRSMQVRGAPLIGAAAAYGICLALRADSSDEALERAYGALLAARPTAINLRWALDEMLACVRNRARASRCPGLSPRGRICDEDVAINRAIGGHGARLIGAIAAAKKAGEPVQVLTHCNAGWLASCRFRHGARPDLCRAR